MGVPLFGRPAWLNFTSFTLPPPYDFSCGTALSFCWVVRYLCSACGRPSTHTSANFRSTILRPASVQLKGKPRRSEGGGGGGPGAAGSSGAGGGGGGGGGGGRRVGRRTTIGAKSLGAQFRENLNNLVATVDKTHPHYVRTIKPNDDLKPGNFTYDRIAEQLRNAGVLEVVRVARAGFPVRLGIQEFIDRYGVLAPLVVETAYRNCAQVRLLHRVALIVGVCGGGGGGSACGFSWLNLDALTVR